ncbi:MAG: hypothetical protein MJ188_10600 [Treponema sp.]|nr:hypothetical protein [Treponema sp.]
MNNYKIRVEEKRDYLEVESLVNMHRQKLTLLQKKILKILNGTNMNSILEILWKNLSCPVSWCK